MDKEVVEDLPLFQKLNVFVALTGDERSMITHLHRRGRTFVAGRDISHLALEFRPGRARGVYRHLGLGMLLRVSDHSVEPITDLEVVEVMFPDIEQVFSQAPGSAIAMLWAASRDEAMVVEHLVDLGRRSAVERMAHFLLELDARLFRIGMGMGMGSRAGFACPLTQHLLSEALGLSAVHVNRVPRHLREADLLTFRDGHVAIHDYENLARFADFDSTNLDHMKTVRV